MRCQSTPPHALCNERLGGSETPSPSAGSGGISGVSPPLLEDSPSLDPFVLVVPALDDSPALDDVLLSPSGCHAAVMLLASAWHASASTIGASAGARSISSTRTS